MSLHDLVTAPAAMAFLKQDVKFKSMAEFMTAMAKLLDDTGVAKHGCTIEVEDTAVTLGWVLDDIYAAAQDIVDGPSDVTVIDKTTKDAPLQAITAALAPPKTKARTEAAAEVERSEADSDDSDD